MNTNRDRLDDAIDRVAKQLTHVEDDALFASRVIAALPERATWFGWLTHSWVAGVAMTVIIVGSIAVWNVRRATTELPAASRADLFAFVPPIVDPIAPNVDPERAPSEPALSEPERNRTRTLEPWNSGTLEPWNSGTLEPFVGLPSIEAPKAIAVNDIATQALPVDAALSVPSLAIAELPLTAESFPERD